MTYGPPNLDLAEQAAWLSAFLLEHQLTPELTSHVLGVNQARVWEWLRQRRALPDGARTRLERWAADGCPRFPYWDDI